MSSSEFNPESYAEIDALLPEGCRRCPSAHFMIDLLLAFSSSTGGPIPTIKDIHERCTVHEDQTLAEPMPPSPINLIIDPFNPQHDIIEPSSDDMPPSAFILDDFDDDGCPYMKFYD